MVIILGEETGLWVGGGLREVMVVETIFGSGAIQLP